MASKTEESTDTDFAPFIGANVALAGALPTLDRLTDRVGRSIRKSGYSPEQYKKVKDLINQHGKHHVFDDPELLKKVKKSKGQLDDALFMSLDQQGRKFSKQEVDDLADILGARKGMRNYIYGGTRSDVHGLLHELGHGTGKGFKLRSQLDPAFRALDRAKAPLLLGGQLGIGLGTALAQDEHDLNKMEQLNKIKTLVSTGVELPKLIEEARANIRAHKLGKKFGVNLRKRDGLQAFSTYLASSLGRTALPYYVNKRLIERKRRKKISKD